MGPVIVPCFRIGGYSVEVWIERGRQVETVLIAFDRAVRRRECAARRCRADLTFGTVETGGENSLMIDNILMKRTRNRLNIRQSARIPGVFETCDRIDGQDNDHCENRQNADDDEYLGERKCFCWTHNEWFITTGGDGTTASGCLGPGDRADPHLASRRDR